MITRFLNINLLELENYQKEYAKYVQNIKKIEKDRILDNQRKIKQNQQNQAIQDKN